MQLLVIDGTRPDRTLPELNDRTKTVVALNKADLEGFSDKALPSELAHWPRVKTSALTGGGCSELSTALLKALDCDNLGLGGAVLFTERQRDLLSRAGKALAQAGETALDTAKQSLAQCLWGE